MPNFFSSHARFSCNKLRQFANVVIFSVSCSPLLVYAQQSKPKPLVDLVVLPPSPEAANLGQFGNLPVSHYTGAVQLSIPLAEVVDGPLRVPITLGYNSTGNRVEDMASWVGLGWTLNAGGLITRSVHGRPDDLPSRGSFLNYLDVRSRYRIADLSSGGETPVRAMYYYNLAQGCWDAEPDLFQFNFNGYSGQFLFAWDGTISVQSEHKVKIEPSRDPAFGILSWKVTVPDGTVYTFANRETTNDRRPTGNALTCRSGDASFTSAWFLTSITDVNSEHTISFDYDDYHVSYGPRANEAIRYNKNTTSQCTADQNGFNISTTSHLEYHGLRVRNIRASHEQTQVVFTPGALRTDTDGITGYYTSNLRTLAKVGILDATGQEVRAQVLSYFSNNPTGRLTLQSVQQTGRNGAVLPPYEFAYSDVALPSNVNSYAQDHWGYYNGATTNYTLLPPFMLPSANGNIPLPGADRDVNPTYATAGLMTRVNYPTGGYSEFEYESNDYGFLGGAPIGTLGLYQTVDVVKHASATCDNLTPGSVRIVSDTFTIIPTPGAPPSELRSVGISWGGYNCCEVGASGKPSVSLQRLDGTSVKGATIGYGQYLPLPSQGDPPMGYDNLAPGQYILTAKVKTPDDGIPPDDPQGAPYAVIEVRFKNPATSGGASTSSPIVKKLAGGARVKLIRDYAKAGESAAQKRYFSYTYQNNSALSSGSVHNEPVYQYDSYFMHPVVLNQGALNQMFDRCDNILRVARSCSGLGLTQGSPVGYQEVTVRTDASGASGKTVYKYTSPAGYQNSGAESIPFTPNISRSYMTGLLTQQTEYRKTANGYAPVKRVNNHYEEFTTYTDGFTVAFPASYAYLDNYTYNYEARLYALTIGHGVLSRTRQTLFNSANQDSSYTETAFTYDATGSQMVREQAQISTTEKTITEHFYLNNYIYIPAALAEASAKHLIPELETVTAVEKAGKVTVINSMLSEWNSQAGKLRPRRQLGLRVAAPINKADYQFSALDVLARPDTHLAETMVIDGYDSRGNIVQFHQAQGPANSRLWGHGGTVLLGEAANAPYASVAYTSFESDATGRWRYDSTGTRRISDAHTGHWGYRLDGGVGVSRTGLPAGTYELLYWSRGGKPITTITAGGTVTGIKTTATASGGWEQHRLQLLLPTVATVEINGRGIVVDDLRLHPTGARMTTMTYTPLVGMTSQTDPSGRTIFYEYDNLGRLLRVRDEQGRVLTEQEYRYAAQP